MDVPDSWEDVPIYEKKKVIHKKVIHKKAIQKKIVPKLSNNPVIKKKTNRESSDKF